MTAQEALKNEVADLLHAKGPMSGSALQERLGADILELWRACQSAPDLQICRFGQRYLRLDHRVEGEARLSPSIRREFMTYSVISTKDLAEDAVRIATSSTDYIKAVSQRKRELALECVHKICAQCPPALTEHVVFLLAGDIVYNMGHEVPRPESSTGKMVCGSDLDVIIVYDEQIDPEWIRQLDDVTHKTKHFMLSHPSYKEELDYIIKPFSRVLEQLKMDRFPHRVACKILWEAEFLYGNRPLAERIKNKLELAGIHAQMKALIRQAHRNRERAESTLLHDNCTAKDMLHLFYTQEESEEIF